MTTTSEVRTPGGSSRHHRTAGDASSPRALLHVTASVPASASDDSSPVAILSLGFRGPSFGAFTIGAGALLATATASLTVSTRVCVVSLYCLRSQSSANTTKS